MSVLTQYYEKNLVEPLYKEGFISRLANVTEYLNAKTVHLPHYNALGQGIVKNGAVIQNNFSSGHTETEVTFNIDDYRAPQPIHVQDIDELQTSYAKMDTVFRNSILEFKENVEDVMIADIIADHADTTGIRTAGVEVLTTGAAGTNNGLGNSGSFKKITLDDFIELDYQFNESLVKGERFLLIDNTMYKEILAIPGIQKHMEFGSNAEGVTVTGMVAKLMGINIIKRKTVEVGSAGAERLGLGFVSNSILTAHQPVQTYPHKADVYKQADLFSFRLAMGVHIPRADKAGVIILKQG